MIMLIIMLSAMIGYVIALERVPQSAAEWIVGVTQNPQVLISLLVAVHPRCSACSSRAR